MTRRALVRAGGAGAAVAAVWALPAARDRRDQRRRGGRGAAGRQSVASSPRTLHLDLPEQLRLRHYRAARRHGRQPDDRGGPCAARVRVRRRQSVPGGRERPLHAGQRPGQRLDPDPAQRGQAGGRRGRGAERRPRVARPADDRGRHQRLQQPRAAWRSAMSCRAPSRGSSCPPRLAATRSSRSGP